LHIDCFIHHPPAEARGEGKDNNTFFARIDSNELGFGGWVMKKQKVMRAGLQTVIVHIERQIKIL
jgi:hypothetical protein